TAGVVLAWVGPAGAAIQAAMTGEPPVVRVAVQAAGLTVFSVVYLRAVRSVLAGRVATRTVAAAGAVTLALLAGPHSGYLSWITPGAAWASLAVLGVSTPAAAVVCGATTLLAPIVALKGLPARRPCCSTRCCACWCPGRTGSSCGCGSWSGTPRRAARPRRGSR